MRIALRTFLIFMVFMISACQVWPEVRQAGSEGEQARPTLRVTAAPSLAPKPTATFTALPTRTPPPTPTSPPAAENARFQVRWHPDGPLYSGDRISVEVIPEKAGNLSGKALKVELETGQGAKTLGTSKFENYGLGNRLQATLVWFWDTTDLNPGEYSIRFTVLPEEYSWTETVRLLAANELPGPEARAKWQTVEGQCCRVYYLSGTAAERDISGLVTRLDEQAAEISDQLGSTAEEKISVVLLPRVLGHGGFTSDSIAVSYLDRNYAGSGTDIVLHHELVHWLDGKAGGDLRPSLLIEGLAVYLTGGHFKPEPIIQRAAALLPAAEGCTTPGGETITATTGCGLDRFVPLKELADNFYPSQHEIGYIEAGALVEYMVQRWGWEAFNSFYRDIHPPAQPTADKNGDNLQSEAIESGLHKHFGIDFKTLEDLFITRLREVKLTPEGAADVRVSIEYYETMRRYQQLLDPSAYFLFAWLVDSTRMREEGITGDYLRHPGRPENITLELMFAAADAALRNGKSAQAVEILTAIGEALDRIAEGVENPLGANAMVQDYAELAQVVERAGYQPQRVELEGDQAKVWVSAGGSDLTILEIRRGLQGWQVTERLSELSRPRVIRAVNLWAGVQPIEKGTEWGNAVQIEGIKYQRRPHAYAQKYQ